MVTTDVVDAIVQPSGVGIVTGLKSRRLNKNRATSRKETLACIESVSYNRLSRYQQATEYVRTEGERERERDGEQTGSNHRTALPARITARPGPFGKTQDPERERWGPVGI